MLSKFGTILDGYKVYLLGGFAIMVGVVKLASNIPDIEAITLLGVDDPWAMITAGWAVIGGRSLISKIFDPTKTP